MGDVAYVRRTGGRTARQIRYRTCNDHTALIRLVGGCTEEDLIQRSVEKHKHFAIVPRLCSVRYHLSNTIGCRDFCYALREGYAILGIGLCFELWCCQVFAP